MGGCATAGPLGLRLSALPVPLRLSTRERWLLLPGPSLLSSSFLELSSLLRVEGILAISSLPTARGSSSRRLEMRLTMGRVTQASTSNTNGKRQDTRAMPGLTSSRVGSRREDLAILGSIFLPTQHLTMTTSICRG